jgi:hypothetical protein
MCTRYDPSNKGANSNKWKKKKIKLNEKWLDWIFLKTFEYVYFSYFIYFILFFFHFFFLSLNGVYDSTRGPCVP